MRKRIVGCSSVRGTLLDQVHYPHPFEPGVTVVRLLSNKKVKLNETVAKNDAAFGGLGREGGYLLPGAKVGFPYTGREASGHSRFVGVNAVTGVSTAVKIDPETPYDPEQSVSKQYTYLIDYPNLILAAGKVPPIAVTVTLDREARKISCVQAADTTLGTNRNPDDVGYCVLYDPTSKTCIVQRLRVRSEEGATSTAIPANVHLDTLFAYVFTARANGKPTSDSECKLQGDSNLVAINCIAKDMKLKFPLAGAIDKLNAAVDMELARRATERERLREAEEEKREEEKARRIASGENAAVAAEERDALLDSILDDVSGVEDAPGEHARQFDERMQVLADTIFTLKKKHEGG